LQELKGTVTRLQGELTDSRRQLQDTQHLLQRAQEKATASGGPAMLSSAKVTPRRVSVPGQEDPLLVWLTRVLGALAPAQDIHDILRAEHIDLEALPLMQDEHFKALHIKVPVCLYP
jgi:hypothetical protein